MGGRAAVGAGAAVDVDASAGGEDVAAGEVVGLIGEGGAARTVVTADAPAGQALGLIRVVDADVFIAA